MLWTREFTLETPVTGPARVVATHPKLSRQGAAEKEVVLSMGDTALVEFATLPLAGWVRSQCGAVRRRAGIVGLAWQEDGTVDRTAALTATWRTATGGQKEVRSRAEPGGSYAFCDLPPDQPIEIRLMRGSMQVSGAMVRLGWEEFQWLELRRPLNR